MLRKALFILAGITLSANLYAISIELSELPAEIQACQTTGTCFAFQTSFYDMPNLSGAPASDGSVNPYSMNAFHLVDIGTGQLSVLARYNLVAPSGEQIEDTVQPLAGSVWLRLDTVVETGATTAQADLYLDYVDPTPGNLFFLHPDGLNLEITLSREALLGGSGYQQVGCCEEPSYTGNMSIRGEFAGEALLPCAAEGCFSSARLNLLYVLYSDPDGDGNLELGIDPLDGRNLLFNVGDYDPYGGLEGTGSMSSQSYYVSAVPLPPALYFLGSGLLMLAGCGRETMKRNRG